MLAARGSRGGNVVGPGTARPGPNPLISEASTRDTSKDFHGCAGSGGDI